MLSYFCSRFLWTNDCQQILLLKFCYMVMKTSIFYVKSNFLRLLSAAFNICLSTKEIKRNEYICNIKLLVVLQHTRPRTSYMIRPSAGQSLASALPLYMYLNSRISAAIRFNYWWGGAFVSISINEQSCFLCCVPDGAPHKQGHHLHLHQKLRHMYTSSYISLNIGVGICSLVSLTISDSCQKGTSWPPCPLCTFHSAVDLVCWEFGAVRDELVDI